MENVSIFWFRRDLRSHDNRGLSQALKEGHPVIPVFIFDRDILDDLQNERDPRVMFIHQQVQKLHEQFKQYNSGFKVFHSTPIEAFSKLQAQYKIEKVFANRDYEPYARRRDEQITQLLKAHGAELILVKDQVIFDPEEILNDECKPYKVFTPYKNKWRERLKPNDLERSDSDQQLNNLLKFDAESVPSLEVIGFKESDLEIPEPHFQEEILSKYQERRNFPGIKSTSRLGIHLRHGTVSIREAVQKGTEYSDTWLDELIWREFYMMILYHWPKVVECAFKPAYDRIEWINDEEAFDRWCEGKTGYPIVDAGMRELNETGFMHNRLRMITSSFLSKMLLIDWRWGESYFAEKLLDYELASNNGGWQWAAGTGTDAQPYFRIFNPYSQTEKFDKDLSYIRKWVNEFETDEYPEPIIDYKFARERALETYKRALS